MRNKSVLEKPISSSSSSGVTTYWRILIGVTVDVTSNVQYLVFGKIQISGIIKINAGAELVIFT